MEKLSLEKFNTSKMSKGQMFKVKGGEVETQWKGSNGGGGSDIYYEDLNFTDYDDGCHGENGIVSCP